MLCEQLVPGSIDPAPKQWLASSRNEERTMACTTYQALEQTPLRSDRVGHPQASSHGSAARWYEYVGMWFERSLQRKALRELAERDDALLKDIGLHRDEALREAAKPFWMR